MLSNSEFRRRQGSELARRLAEAFVEAFRPTRTLLVGGDGIGVETFLSRPVEEWLAE